MRRILFTLLVLSTITNMCFGSINWLYKETMNGITLVAEGPWDDSLAERRIFDGFLDYLVDNLDNNHDRPEIYVLLDGENIYASRIKKEWKATIAYDTLRDLDHDFLSDYISYKQGVLPYTNKELSFLKQLPDTVDMFTSYDAQPAPVGLKIIYADKYGTLDSAANCNELFSLVEYAVQHVDEIKAKQNKMVISYSTDRYSCNLSILTIDTGMIRSIPVKTEGFDPKNIQPRATPYRYILITLFTMAVVAFLYNAKRRKYSVS